MTNGDREEQICLSHRHISNGFLLNTFIIIFRSSWIRYDVTKLVHVPCYLKSILAKIRGERTNLRCGTIWWHHFIITKTSLMIRCAALFILPTGCYGACEKEFSHIGEKAETPISYMYARMLYSVARLFIKLRFQIQYQYKHVALITPTHKPTIYTLGQLHYNNF